MVNQYCAHSFTRNWQLPFLNQWKGENDRRKYFMINLQERMLPTLAGVEPAISWSPVGWHIQLSHRGRHMYYCIFIMSMYIFSAINAEILQNLIDSINYFCETSSIWTLVLTNIYGEYNYQTTVLEFHFGIIVKLLWFCTSKVGQVSTFNHNFTFWWQLAFFISFI